MTDLATLLADGRIALQPAPSLDRTPPALGRPDLPDRIAGMLLGLAIGDSLGATTEGVSPAVRRARHGEVRDYLPHPRAGGRAVGLPTDDTQLAFWTLERFLADGRLDPEAVLRTFSERPIFGIGATVHAAIQAFRHGTPWHRAGPPSAGNGALMRIAPVLIAHVHRPSPSLWEDSARLAMITHNDAGSTAACIAFIDTLWTLLGRDDPPGPGWWVDHFVAAMAPLEGDTRFHTRTPHITYQGPIAAFAAEHVRTALDRDLATDTACERWGSGAYLLETIPSVLLLLARHGHDPEDAIVRAVNDTRDNDTIAAIVGAAVGALHGASALPRRWRDALLGRTAEADDGRVFALIEQALSGLRRP